MPVKKADFDLDGVPLVRLESKWLCVDVAPGVGGRIVSLVEKAGGHEFLWRNSNLRLELLPGGTEYDPNFYGGIDELLPNDIPETIDGIACPDHGELWTTPLNWTKDGNILKLENTLPGYQLHYERQMTLREDAPMLDLKYRIRNLTNRPKQFLWKLHPALAIQEGDVIECPARSAQVVDPNWSRFKQTAPFAWPNLDGQAVNRVPAADNTMDFFYLFDLQQGAIAWRRPSAGLKFAYHFDTKVFPFAWIFASYGGFLGHYVAIIEPCTAMPISVNDAARNGTCTTLAAGESLETSVVVWAGREESGTASKSTP